MSDTDIKSVGTVVWWARGEHDDWATNDKTYVFPRRESNGIVVQARKQANKKIEILLSGPYSRDFLFVADIPACGPKGLFIMLAWKDGSVSLSLNSIFIEKKSKDAPFSTQKIFTSLTDEGTKAVELAIVFDRVADLILKIAVQSWGQSGSGPVMVPGIVCDAFAVELYLKALYYFDYKTGIRGHNLRSLFSGQLPATQQRIRDEYAAWFSALQSPNPISESFDKVLDTTAKAFEAWRYLYENGTEDSYLTYVSGGLKFSVRKTAEAVFSASFANAQNPSTAPTSQPQ